MPNDLWDIVGRFGDPRAADTFARFLIGRGVPVRVSEPGTGGNEYAILVPKAYAESLEHVMNWVAAVTYDGYGSVAAMLGLLSAEGIPARASPPSRTNVGPFPLYVPRALLSDALDVLNAAPLSDEELEAQAMASRKHRGRPTGDR